MNPLTVVIPYRNGPLDTLRALVQSIPRDWGICIVDDQSAPALTLADLGDDVEQRPVVIFRRAERLYFSGAVNVGLDWVLEYGHGDDVLLLNQDVRFVDDGWLDYLAHYAPQFDICGDPAAPHPAWPQGYVQGTFMFIRRAVVERIGGFDATWYPLWGATLDYQTRACRAGFRALPLEVPGLEHERAGFAELYGKRIAAGDAIRAALDDEPQRAAAFLRTPPRVSVIVTCHNYGRYLDDCLASLMGGASSLGTLAPQTFQGFEVVVVDDASTDGSREMVAAREDLWAGVRAVLLDTNVGTAAAYNAGIRASFGHYITLLSADDMREHASIERLMRALDEHPHSMAYDDIQILDHGKLIRNWVMPEYDFDLLLQRNIAHAGIMFPRVAWQETGGYPAVMRDGREDWAFNVALGTRGYCGVHVPHYGYWYRREGQNRTLRNTNPDDRERFSIQMHALFPSYYKGERPAMCCGERNGRRGVGDSVQLDPATTKSASAPQALPGAAGMLVLEYQGANWGIETFWGPLTSTQYRFGGARKLGYVDVRDARGDGKTPGMLTYREQGRTLFREVPSQVEPAPTVVVDEPTDLSDAPEVAPYAATSDTDASTASEPKQVKASRRRSAKRSA